MRRINIADVGAREGAQHPWIDHLDGVHLIFFEPEPKEFQKLAANKSGNSTVLPYALSDETKARTLHVTRSPGCSSLYEPNHELLSRFPEAERFDVLEKVPVDTTTIDALAQEKGLLADLDFIKLDVQGGELDIIKGGLSFLKNNLIGLESEVEFLEMYKKQPLFSEVDRFVRENLELRLYDLRKAYWKQTKRNSRGTQKGTIAFGDALYLRPPEKLIDWCLRFPNPSDKLQAAVFIAAAYGITDYGFTILKDPRSREILAKDVHEQWASKLEALERASLPSISSGFVSRIFYSLHKLFQPMHNYWAYGETRLGQKKRLLWWE